MIYETECAFLMSGVRLNCLKPTFCMRALTISRAESRLRVYLSVRI